MAKNDNDPMVDRIQATIANWTDEVTEAHQGLTRQIAEARYQLDTLATVLSKRNGNGHAPDAGGDNDLDRLREALAEQSSENAQLGVRIAAFEGQVQELKGRLGLSCQRESELKKNASEAARKQAEAESRANAALARESEALARGENLDAALAQALEKERIALAALTEAESTIEEMRSAQSGLQEDASEKQRRVAELDATITRLRNEYEQACKEHDRVRTQDEQYAYQNRVTLWRTAEALDITRNQARELESKCAAMDRALAKTRGIATDLRAQRALLEKEIRQLCAEADERARNEHRITCDLEAVRAERDQHAATVSELRERTQELRTTLSERQSALEQLQHDIGELQSTCDTQLRERDDLRRNAEHLTRQLAEQSSDLHSLRERLESAHHKNTTLEATVEALRCELRDTVDRKNNDLNHAHARIAECQSELEAAHNEIERRACRADADHAELRQYEQLRRATQARLADWIARHETLAQTLNEARATAQADREAARVEHARLQAECAQLNEALSAKSAALDSVAGERDLYRTRSEDLQQKLTEHDAQRERDAEAIARLQREKEGLNAELTKSHEIAVQQRAMVDALRRESVERKNTIAELTERSKSNDATIATLQADLENEQAAHRDTADRRDAAQAETASTSEALEAIRAELAGAEERFQTEHEAREAAQAQRDAANTELEAERKRLETLHAELAQANARIQADAESLESTRAELSTAKQRVEAQAENLDATRAALQESEQARDFAQQEAAELHRRIERLNREQTDAAAHWAATEERLRSEIDEANTATENEREALRNATAALQEAKQIGDAARNEARKLNNAIASLREESEQERAQFTKELERLRALRDAGESELATLRSTLREKEAALREANAEADTNQRTVERLQDRVNALEQQDQRERVAMQTALDAAQNQVRATGAALEGAKAENATLTTLLREREDVIGATRQRLEQLDAEHTALVEEVDGIRNRERIAQAEVESMSSELERIAEKERNAARNVARLTSELENQKSLVRQHEASALRERKRTAQMIQQTMAALQNELDDHGAVRDIAAPLVAHAKTNGEESNHTNGNGHGNTCGIAAEGRDKT